MERRLPPLNALRAFEAAGRHLSFTKAVDELYVTPAAISHQVKALEEGGENNWGFKLPHGALDVPLSGRLNVNSLVFLRNAALAALGIT